MPYYSLLYLAEGRRDMSAPWARYLGDIAGVTNPKIVIVDLYNQQVGYHFIIWKLMLFLADF